MHPIVIAHRGASGYLPEHTLEAYALAIEQGADFIEPDLVATRDGHLIARHEPNLIATTNVRELPQFAARKRRVTIDGADEEGFFASDFTLEEIKTLRAVQAFAERDQRHNGQFAIPTLAEIIALVQRKSAQAERRVGIYPETKHPSYHRALGLMLEDRLLDALARAGWNQPDAPVYIQSFEPASLKYLRARSPVPLVQLISSSALSDDGTHTFDTPLDCPYDWTRPCEWRSYRDMLTPEGLLEIKTYADAIGPWKRLIISAALSAPRAANEPVSYDERQRRLLPPTTLIEDAHRAGLLVHAWTFRSDSQRLAADYSGDAAAEYRQFFALGVDGVFSDFPDAAIAARTRLRR